MSNNNIQHALDNLLNGLQERPSLLLHSCCGPCSSYVIEYLSKYFELTVLYYNPNIQPEDEYRLRLQNQLKVLERFGAALLDCPYDAEAFEAAVEGFESEPEGGARCERCFKLRLEYTARCAAERGYEYYCTTLSVSPYKNAPLLNSLGEQYAEKYGVIWLPSDFKKRGGYQRSIELSKELGLYRQHFCGCKYSSRPEEKKQ